MRRREFFGVIGGAAAWPLAARAQQERPRRIGILLNAAVDDPNFKTWVATFLQSLQQFGWTAGGNVRIDTRWAGGNTVEIRRHASELIALAPDVILAHGTSTVGPLLQLTRTVPIVFPIIADPVGAGFVDSLARPGGNATGFMEFEYSMGGKWLGARHDASGSASGYARLRSHAVCRHPSDGAVAHGGGDPGWLA